MISDFMKGGDTMNNLNMTNRDIVYLSCKSSGIASAHVDTAVIPNAISNMTKGNTMIIFQPRKISKPITNEK
jgi:hypothetical protein